MFCECGYGMIWLYRLFGALFERHTRFPTWVATALSFGPFNCLLLVNTQRKLLWKHHLSLFSIMFLVVCCILFYLNGWQPLGSVLRRALQFAGFEITSEGTNGLVLRTATSFLIKVWCCHPFRGLSMDHIFCLTGSLAHSNHISSQTIMCNPTVLVRVWTQVEINENKNCPRNNHKKHRCNLWQQKTACPTARF